MKPLKILAQAVVGKGQVRFSADLKNSFSRTVNIKSNEELSAQYMLYKIDLLNKFPDVQIDPTRPNLFREYLYACLPPKGNPTTGYDHLFPGPITGDYLFKGLTVATNGTAAGSAVYPERVIPEKETEFEVNMVEALVGWKAFRIRRVVQGGVDYGYMLYTSSMFDCWPRLQALEAKCNSGCPGPHPRERCSCGIYAGDSRKTVEEYGPIMGQIYGWGRYIRGESGWRCQFAYPKMFVLKESQMDYLDDLKGYKVPIYVDTPTKMYDPTEEGFSNGNWSDQTDRDIRADSKPGPFQDANGNYDGEDDYEG